MNIQLEKLFDTYSVSLGDRHEIRQIFQFVSSHKKQRILDNFENIYTSLQELQGDLIAEQEILLGKAMENIDIQVSHIKKKQLQSFTGGALATLKNSL